MQISAVLTIIAVTLGTLSKAHATFDHQHPDLTKALNAIVVYKDDASEVNYAQLQKRPQDLIRYLKVIGKVSEKTFKEFSLDEQKAFLINAYNAFTLQLVKDNFPVPSIKKIQAPGGPWKMKFIRLFGREYNLNDLKHRLRQEYADARLVFALTSASIGSPRLRNEAYVATQLNTQLEDQMKSFLQHNSLNQLDTGKKVAKISSFFHEVKEDLDKTGLTVAKFIAPYIAEDAKIRAEIESGAYTIEYLDPNWNLNKLSKQ